MSVKYTPGPWLDCQPDSNFTKGCRVIKDGERKNVADIANFRGAGYANARLIAAAPEMLEALKLARQIWSASDSCAEIDAIDAAIAKATT